jgi:hypothetical protein
MEKIEWICKPSKNNNKLKWDCHPRMKEHFESTSSVGLLGTTSFYAGPVDINLGPANFGPSSSLCDDTTGYYKMAEYIFQPDWQHPPYNTDTFKGLNGKMYCDGPEYTGEWNGLYFCGTGIGPWFLGFCAIDSNGRNFMSAVQDFAKYQEFSGAFSVIIRDKNTPTNYYLFPRVAIDCNPLIPNCRIYNSTVESQAISEYRLGYNPLMDIAGFLSETNFNGQSGGTPPPKGSGGVLYEVFLKPFIRPTYPFTPESAISSYNNLPSDLQAKTILWYDASDPNADGSTLPDNTPLKRWMDKSPNKLNLVRAPPCPHDDSKLNLDFSDGEYIANRNDFDAQGNIIHKWKNRLPRLRTNFKNGLSVVRFNGNNGFTRPYASGPCADMTWRNFYESGIGQIKDKADLVGHSIFIVSYQTEYGPNDGYLFGLKDCKIGSSKDVPAIVGFGRSSLTGDAANYMIDNYNILNKWVITSVIKFKSSQNPSHKIFANGTQVNQNWGVGNHNNYAPINRPDLWDFGYIRRWDDELTIGCRYVNPNSNAVDGFSGDIAEIICFPEELSDIDRVKVETYLAQKWNLTAAMNIPLPTNSPGIGFRSQTSQNSNSNAVQLFTTTNFVIPSSSVINSFCIGFVRSRNGQPYQMAYSQDGLTNWQVSPSTPKFGDQLFCSAYNGSMWIAGTSENNPSKCGMLSSTDGINWNPILSDGLAYSIPKQYTCRKICWGNSMWVAVIGERVYASTDGIKFRRGRNSPNVNTVVYGNGIFLAGSNAQILMSTDGMKFTPVGTLDGQHRAYSQTSDFVFFNNMWIAGYAFTGNQGADNIIYTSTDLKTWTIQSSATSLVAIQPYGNGVYSLCTDGKVVIAGITSGNNNCLIYSTDGINWKNSNATSFGCTWCHSTTYNGKYFIANISLEIAFTPSANFRTVYSTDGITWTDSPDAGRFNPNGFVFSDSQNVKPYNGPSIDNNFPIGSYTNTELKKIGPSSVMSIQVPNGLEAILYENTNMTGKAISITSDIADLSNLVSTVNPNFNWGKQMKSLVVRNYKPLALNNQIKLIADHPIGVLFPGTVGIVVQISGNQVQIQDANNPGLLYWYNISDLQIS